MSDIPTYTAHALAPTTRDDFTWTPTGWRTLDDDDATISEASLLDYAVTLECALLALIEHIAPMTPGAQARDMYLNAVSTAWDQITATRRAQAHGN